MSILKIKNDKGKWENIKTIIGPRGKDGAPGPAGRGVPAGGQPGDVLVKNSEVDGDTIWATPSKGASIWTGTYEDYIANKAAIDAEYDIVLTEDSVQPSGTLFISTVPTLCPTDSTSYSNSTANGEIQTNFTQGEFTIESVDSVFRTLHEIGNHMGTPIILKGFTIELCDSNGDNRQPSYSATNAHIPINPESFASYYHEVDMVAEYAGQYIIITYEVEVQ